MAISTRAHIYDFGNMYAACATSYRGKSARQRMKPEVRQVMDDVDKFVADIIDQLRTGKYRVGPYRHWRLRDKKKTRNISVLQYPDRCTQNQLKDAVEPLIINQATDDMCAGLPHRGVTAKDPKWCVVKKVQRHMRKEDSVWIWLGDFTKFYDTTRNIVIMKLLERILSDKVTLAYLRQHIMNLPSLAIGDPISHLIASLVVSVVVRFLKEHGVKRIVNYADDFLVFTDTKWEAQRVRRMAMEFAVTHLRLHFKPSQVRRVDAAPFRFCGYVFHPNGKVFIAKDTKLNYIKKRHSSRSLASYNGLLLVCNSRHLRKKVELFDNYKLHGKNRDSICRTTDAR